MTNMNDANLERSYRRAVELIGRKATKKFGSNNDLLFRFCYPDDSQKQKKEAFTIKPGETYLGEMTHRGVIGYIYRIKKGAQ